MNNNFTDLTGKKINKLTVIRFVSSMDVTWHKRKWLCQCDCGTEKEISHAQLVTKHNPVVSCGCERLLKLREAIVTHGKSTNRLINKKYGVWATMIQRCTNSNAHSYNRYGGRGITVCDAWLESYEQFDKDTPGYEPGLKIDRIDNNRGYAPGNTHWVTNIENCQNTRKNKRLTYNGKTLTYSQWGRLIGLSPTIISYRQLRGWSVEDTLTKPTETGVVPNHNYS